MPALGFDRVAIPGDRSLAIRQKRMLDGISVADDIWTNLLQLAGDES
jgi:LDH2 family malate/lactate/ureidoglycolate dehydrogenase